MPVDENKELKTEKNGFRKFAAGAAAGMLFSITAVLAVTIYFRVENDHLIERIYAQDNSEESDIAESSSEQDELIDNDFIYKLQVLEECVDDYFLFEGQDTAVYQENIYKGFMEALDDPYSCYYTAEEYEQLMESIDGSYVGIGVVVSQNAETKAITIVRPFPDGPGALAGMLPGDIIAEVNGEDISGMEINAVVSLIKGEEGTDVNVSVYRESEKLDFTMTRKKIEVPTVSSQMLEGDIGYVAVTEFDTVTTQQFKDAVEQLKSQNMKGLVIDIRDNPGGILNVVVDMLDYMLPEGTIVYTEDKNGEGEKYTSDAEHYFDLPLAVLVNGNSASASEIFSGAIQDYKIGTIVGTQTFGKGIVQTTIPFSDGSAIKLTISRYFTPNGECIHGVGITPDIEVELDEELKTRLEVTFEEDNQLQAAIEAVKSEIDSNEAE